MRFRLSAAGAVLLFAQVLISQSAPDPWTASELLEPAALAHTLESSGKPPVVIAVAFKVLYDARHLPHAIYAGPGSTPQGIDMLKKAAASLPKDSEIVLYCGCCPMEKCPNIRPSYQTLKQMGFTKIRVLHVPTNMATDWFGKGYPSEEGAAK